jgi:hypothetical protein
LPITSHMLVNQRLRQEKNLSAHACRKDTTFVCSRKAAEEALKKI